MVTLIYDKINEHEVIILMFKEEVRFFFKHPHTNVNYLYRAFDSLAELVEFLNDEDIYLDNLPSYEFLCKNAFKYEEEFYKYINNLCENAEDLKEFYLDY